jgi:hypothetical protein
MGHHKKKKAASSTNNRVQSKQKQNHWGKSFVVIAVFISLAARLFYLISRFAVNLFYQDQWDFNNVTLFDKHTLGEMFRLQHGPHRQGLGAIISYLIEPHFRWNSRTESFLVWGIIVLAAICALWLKRRLFGAFTISDICIPLIFFVPGQFETLFITANLAHGPMPLLLILLYCLSWTIPKPLPRYGFVLLINFLTIYTGFGIFLGIITPMAIATDYYLYLRPLKTGKLYLSASLALSLASLGSFFVQYTYNSAVDCSPDFFTSPLRYAHFICVMFANSLGIKGAGTFQTLSGAALILAMGLMLVMIVRSIILAKNMQGRRGLVAAILVVYCLLFCMNTAYGRSCLGVESAQNSRYIIYMGMGLLGLYFYCLMIRETPAGVLFLTLMAIALIATVPIRDEDEITMTAYRTLKQRWKQCYLEISDINQCNRLAGFSIYPDPERTHLKAKLDYLKQTKQNLYSDVP